MPPETQLRPSGPARAPALRPPDLDVYAAAGGPVALNNPLSTCVVEGSRITIVRSFIGFWQCGQAQPSYAKTLRNSSAQHRRCSARSPRARRSSAFTSFNAARASLSAGVEVATFGTTSARHAALPASTPA